MNTTITSKLVAVKLDLPSKDKTKFLNTYTSHTEYKKATRPRQTYKSGNT